MRFHLLTLLPVLGFLASCTAPISVHVEDPAPPVAKVVSASALQSAGQGSEEGAPTIGPLLDSLRKSYREIARGNDEAIPEYNYLTARLIDRLIEGGVRPWVKSISVRSGRTRYLIRGTEPGDLRDPDRRFVPTDRLTFTGRYATDAGRTPGVGAPLVTYLQHAGHVRKTIPYRAVTALIRFNGDEAVIDLVDPFQTHSVSIRGRQVPLHADFNSSVAYILSKERIDLLGFARLMNPTDYDDTARLSAIQPYDPKKIPVLFVHGLQDTPASFAPMYFQLMDDPGFRRHFQVWAFSYPSGYPYPLPAATLRQELDAMRKLYPDHKDIVIVGHSMGGLVSRLMVTSVGDRIWLDYFGTPPSETPLKGDSRQLIKDALIFDAREEIGRAIFIAAPHRGSQLATNIIGWIGVKLVRFPATIADVRDSVVNVLTADQSGMRLDRFPSSIDTLSPNNRFVNTINQFPIDPGIPYHSIMGDRGRGNTPDSSDGVVAYWSSHLEGAVSEKIVPSDHMAHQHPEGIEEVRRILYLHAGLPYKARTNLTPPEKEERRRPLGSPHR